MLEYLEYIFSGEECGNTFFWHTNSESVEQSAQQWRRRPKKLGWTKRRGKFFSTKPFRLSENVGNVGTLFSIF